MNKIRIGILGTSEIAFRRFLPALKNNSNFTYVGVATRDVAKADKFIENYGGKVFDGYESAINSSEIDALYIPLPPAFHYEWAERALNSGKHVMLEKPFTTEHVDTCKLIDIAKNKKLAIHENYMFMFHNQIKKIYEILDTNSIGDIRLIRASFGFPHRGQQDFRYNKELGGGALLDCGGYPIKLVSSLLGEKSKVSTSTLYMDKEKEVDIYGNATLENENGNVAQISFGMDNSYKCEVEIWGSNGEIVAPRIFTAPADLEPEINLTVNGVNSKIDISCDDQFYKSINHFYDSINNNEILEDNFKQIMLQANLVEQIKNNSKIYYK
ncbi:Gfo/Idh/MocA family protein [Clostridium butyricum]|uniref:Gfo/Idh/MocA family protein n=1 Tax=Clostridium butyricum TaxID=1492 RepID=UPI002105911F|nr:Gfo/Idh/MocA family oxidoreductase [Clostridium butyricum]MCQ2015558.1 Gfo/Idh/MocA family oxidoreductase [Clostridium butyricum]MCQ2027392.1 Gfo/Idh/MocA family oxidoreductase [Clostridium butyricum]